MGGKNKQYWLCYASISRGRVDTENSPLLQQNHQMAERDLPGCSYLCDMTHGLWADPGALPTSLIAEITEYFIPEVSSSKDGYPSVF